MELVTVGSILLCALVGTVVGLKLLGIAARSGKFPEFAIGAALFVYSAVGQTSALARAALSDEASVALRMTLAVVSLLALYATLLGLSLFTWQVFGAESRWRQALTAGVAVTGLLFTALTIRAAWLQITASVPLDLYGRIGITPHFTLAFGWVSLESLRYHAQMRRRQALGLADPVVTNRFLVWGAGEGVASLVVLALFVTSAVHAETSIGDPLIRLFMTLAGLVNALVWWLSFMPPKAYLRWVRGDAAEGAADA
jgi:hypothetical protein